MIGQSEIARLWNVVNRAVRILPDGKDAVFVGAGDVAHAAVIDSRIVERDPGRDQAIFRDDAEVTLVLVGGLGLSAGWFEKHLVAEDFHARAEEPTGAFEKRRVSGDVLKKRCEADEESSTTNVIVQCLGAVLVRSRIPLAADFDTLWRMLRISNQGVHTLTDRDQIGLRENIFDRKISITNESGFHFRFEHRVHEGSHISEFSVTPVTAQ